MDEDPLFRGPFWVDAIRWVFVILTVFGVFIRTPFYRADSSGPAVEERIICRGKVVSAQGENHTGVKIQHQVLSVQGKSAERLFSPIVIRVANRYQIDPALVKAIIMAESGYNPQAISKKGARGLMQLMPRTAEAMGVVDTFDPENNINGGVRYFKKLLRQFDNDVKLALAAYNAGSRRVREHRGIPPFKATHYYIKKVLEHYQNYKKELVGKSDKV